MTDATHTTLTDFATLAFVIAHGADADLDTREVDVLARRVATLAATLSMTPLSSSELGTVLQDATEQYSELAVVDANAILSRLGQALERGQRREVYAAFVEVAAADGTILTMEQTLLRHIAAAWELS